jgi:hypothetical protein
MGLSHFNVEHVFLDSFLGEDGEEDFKITATTESRWNYMLAKIKWYLPSAVRHSDETLEHTLVHELTHVLLSPEQVLIDARLQMHSDAEGLSEAEFLLLRDSYYEHLELATEMAAKAIYAGWLHKPSEQ